MGTRTYFQIARVRDVLRYFQFSLNIAKKRVLDDARINREVKTYV